MCLLIANLGYNFFCITLYTVAFWRKKWIYRTFQLMMSHIHDTLTKVAENYLLGPIICVLQKFFAHSQRFIKNLIHFSFTDKKTSIIKITDNYLVIDKEYDLKINSNDKSQRTVQTILRHKYPQFVSKVLFHEFYFVHRLDYATSGLMVIPLNKTACKVISSAFEKRKINKYYVALVRGFISEEILNICDAIGNDESAKHIQKMCTVNNKFCSSPRNCCTVVLVLELGLYENYPATKILIRPVTGRRHQIRVHCNNLGHTIIGDYTYSNKKDTKPERMFLHSLRLHVPNCLETIDVRTEDPFTQLKTPLWTPINILNNLCEESFKKIDHC